MFLPMTNRNEPDTWLIIDRVRREFPQIRISIPKVNAQTDGLDHLYFEGLHQLEQNSWGIPEPRDGERTRIEDIDLILVPLLTFDHDGHRLGYGKGYYDRFLSECRADTQKVGISFFEPTVEFLPAEPHDVAMDAVVTPRQFYKF